MPNFLSSDGLAYLWNNKLKPKFETKVDKISGKGLSSNDFTTAEKNKIVSFEDNISTLNTTKVDKISGKALSSNDYTTPEKNQLATNTSNISALESRINNLRDIFYPVGTFYHSSKDINPSTFIGGTWVKIEGKFLWASSSEYPNGSTGGSATHTMTIAEMAYHGHTFEYMDAQGNWQMAGVIKRGDAKNNLPHVIGVDTLYDTNWQTAQRRIGGAGGSQPFSIMPPYRSVNIWERTA